MRVDAFDASMLGKSYALEAADSKVLVVGDRILVSSLYTCTGTGHVVVTGVDVEMFKQAPSEIVFKLVRV